MTLAHRIPKDHPLRPVEDALIAETDQLYKVLRREGDALISCHGGSGKWTLNDWRSVSGELNPCKRGLHLCREGDLVRWLGEVICTAGGTGGADRPAHALPRR